MREDQHSELVKFYAGGVIVRADGVEYSDSAAHFEIDAGAPFEPLPTHPKMPDPIGRSYSPGKKHRITDGRKAIQIPGAWPFGDQLLARVPELVAAKAAREASRVPTPDPLGVKRDAALEALMARRATDADATPEEKDYQAERGRTPSRSGR